MIKVKYLILGGGPSGLTLANALVQRGENSVLLIEKESEAGGLCRSTDVDGWALDTGGGHFLDVRRPEVCEFLFRFMGPEEWNRYERDSRIRLKGHEVSHPLEANIWQLPEDVQGQYLESIRAAGCNNGAAMPARFTEWIYWKLGERIAADYMIPYNKKMFADELDELGTYWLDKLPNVDYEDTLRSCREHHAYGTQPGHASFYYPKKYGYGEVFNRMAEELGDRIVYNATVSTLDTDSHRITTKEGDEFEGDIVITTVPWNSFDSVTGISDEMMTKMRSLKHSSIEIRYFAEDAGTDAQWVYCPDPELPYHRILVRYNFCKGKGYWTETRSERTSMFKENEGGPVFMNEYAYPLNTMDKPVIMDRLLTFMNGRNIIGLGRWGEHSHFNSDVVIKKSLELSKTLTD